MPGGSLGGLLLTLSLVVAATVTVRRWEPYRVVHEGALTAVGGRLGVGPPPGFPCFDLADGRRIGELARSPLVPPVPAVLHPVSLDFVVIEQSGGLGLHGWSTTTEGCLWTHHEHTQGNVKREIWLHDGQLFSQRVEQDELHTERIDLRTGRTVEEWSCTHPGRSSTFPKPSPNGRLLLAPPLSYSDSFALRVLDSRTGDDIEALRQLFPRVRDARWIQGSHQKLALLDLEGTFHVLDGLGHRPAALLTIPPADEVADGVPTALQRENTLVTVFNGGWRSWDATSGEPLVASEPPRLPVWSLDARVSDGHVILSERLDGVPFSRFHVWELSTGRHRETFQIDDAFASLSKDGMTLQFDQGSPKTARRTRGLGSGRPWGPFWFTCALGILWLFVIGRGISRRRTTDRRPSGARDGCTPAAPPKTPGAD